MMRNSLLLLAILRSLLSYNLVFLSSIISTSSLASASSPFKFQSPNTPRKDDDNSNNDEIQLGTTIVALRTKQGVIVGADTRTSQGTMVSNRHADKLSMLYQNRGGFSCVLCRSGSAADTQFFAEEARWEFRSRALRYYNDDKQEEEEDSPTIDEIARWLRYVMNTGDYSASLLCVGYDPKDKKKKTSDRGGGGGGGGGGGRILSISKSGALLEEGFYAAAGSGSIHIMGLMDSKIKELQQQASGGDEPLMDEEEAIQFVSHLIHRAMARDHASGGAARIVVLNDRGSQSYTVLDPAACSIASSVKEDNDNRNGPHDLKGFKPATKTTTMPSAQQQ